MINKILHFNTYFIQLFIMVTPCFSQIIPRLPEMIQNQGYIYDDYIFSDQITSVRLFKSGNEMSYPFINLNDTDMLELQFDHIATLAENFTATFVHCKADWTAAGTFSGDYINGINEFMVTDYSFSSNTTIPYVHYRFAFPDIHFSFLLSGNYAVMVYKDHNRDSLQFTLRFFVSEPLVGITPVIKAATLADLQRSCHEIDFTIQLNGLTVNDVFSDLKVVLQQNWRSDNLITNLKPRYLKGDELIYDFEEENIFAAGNEFRSFDTRSFSTGGDGIDKMIFLDSAWHVRLITADSRSHKRYSFEKDFNGKYIINASNAFDSNTDADYCHVYFTLNASIPYLNSDVYVFGGLSNWNFSNRNKMVYNYEKKMYELRMLLKQGYYNYQLMALNKETLKASFFTIEGSHAGTENDYFIMVYQRNRFPEYDRLVGVAQINSMYR